VEVSRRTDDSGTLLTEPVVVMSGEHKGRLEVLDQNGRQLGSANRFRREFSYEICDTDGQAC
jgi:hypothetical protein